MITEREISVQKERMAAARLNFLKKFLVKQKLKMCESGEFLVIDLLKRGEALNFAMPKGGYLLKWGINSALLRPVWEDLKIFQFSKNTGTEDADYEQKIMESIHALLVCYYSSEEFYLEESELHCKVRLGLREFLDPGLLTSRTDPSSYRAAVDYITGWIGSTGERPSVSSWIKTHPAEMVTTGSIFNMFKKMPWYKNFPTGRLFGLDLPRPSDTIILEQMARALFARLSGGYFQ